MRTSDIPPPSYHPHNICSKKVTVSGVISTVWEVNIGRMYQYGNMQSLPWEGFFANVGSCEGNSDPRCKTLLSSHMSLHLPQVHLTGTCCKTSLRLPPYMQSMAWWPWRPFCHDIPPVWFYSKHQQPKVPTFMNSLFLEWEAKSGQCLWFDLIWCGITVWSPSRLWLELGRVGCLDKHLAGPTLSLPQVLNGPDMPIKYQLCAPNTRP